MEKYSPVEQAVYGLAALAATTLLFFLAVALISSARSDGETTYCYVSYTAANNGPPAHQLYAYRPWRPDRLISNFSSLEEATTASTLLGCKIGSP